MTQNGAIRRLTDGHLSVVLHLFVSSYPRPLYFWLGRLLLTAFSPDQKASSSWPRRLIRPVADVDCHTAERSTGGGSPWASHKTMEMQRKNKQLFGASKAQVARAPQPLHRQVTASHLRKVARLAELCMARARPSCPILPAMLPLGQSRPATALQAGVWARF